MPSSQQTPAKTDIRTALGALKNKNKRVIGQSYAIQRFGIGDLLKKDGLEGLVVSRTGESTTVRWDSSQLEVIPFSRTDVFTYVRECPPR